MTTQYITQEGDRWDLIADKAYGSSSGSEIKTIQDANPYLPVTIVFSAGIKLVIPIVEIDVSIESLLPPWKRKVQAQSSTQILSDITSSSDTNGSFDDSFD